MKEKKTKKLICNVTGRSLFAGKDYYTKKVAKAGTEELLHKTYICKEAKDLLKKGYSIEDVQTSLNVSYKCTLTDSDIRDIVGNKTSLRLNNSENTNIGIIKTDPKVKQLIENILADE